MKRLHKNRLRIALSLVSLVAILAIALLAAQPGGARTLADGLAYTLDWWTVDGGGTTHNAGGEYTLDGTVGQPDAGLLAGGNYTLGGGFWAGGAAVMHNVYLPIVLR
jgi:hypothetical protein